MSDRGTRKRPVSKVLLFLLSVVAYSVVIAIAFKYQTETKNFQWNEGFTFEDLSFWSQTGDNITDVGDMNIGTAVTDGEHGSKDNNGSEEKDERKSKGVEGVHPTIYSNSNAPVGNITNSTASTASSFKRYDGVAIVTKVRDEGGVDGLKRMLCLLGHSYNDKMNHDIIVFTTIPWKEESIKELQAAVGPTKLTVAVESAPLEDQLAALNSTELKFLRNRCGLPDNDTSPLTWSHHCSEPGSNQAASLGYSWQAEFRSYHIWTHEALKNYRYMFWLDSDALVTRAWDTDPMEMMVENKLVIMYAAFPYGRSQNEMLREKMMKVYNKSICTVRSTPEGTLYTHLCTPKLRVNMNQIGGFHHITDLDVYRKPIHQQFLKEFTGDYRFSRQFDDQAAVTIVAILHQELFGIPNVPILWHERTHNLTLKIAHHGRTDHMKGERVPSATKGTNLFKMIKDDWAGLEKRCGAYFES